MPAEKQMRVMPVPFPPGPGTGRLGASSSGAAERGRGGADMQARGLRLVVDRGYRIRWPRTEGLRLGRGF